MFVQNFLTAFLPSSDNVVSKTAVWDCVKGYVEQYVQTVGSCGV